MPLFQIAPRGRKRAILRKPYASPPHFPWKLYAVHAQIGPGNAAMIEITIDRLRRGERCWLAEIVLRSAGLLLLALCGLLAHDVVRQVQRIPAGTPVEFGIAALVVVCLTAGLALLCFGPHLFKAMPVPPRALLP
jgi:hypothetical protein